MGFSAEIPIGRDRILDIYYTGFVEIIKLLTIIEAKMGQNGKRSKFYTLSGLEYIELDCNRKLRTRN